MRTEVVMMPRRVWLALPADIEPEAKLQIYQALISASIAQAGLDFSDPRRAQYKDGKISSAVDVASKSLEQHLDERDVAISEVRAMVSNLGSSLSPTANEVLAQLLPGEGFLGEIQSTQSGVKAQLVSICDQLLGTQFPKWDELVSIERTNDSCERDVGGVSQPIFDFSEDYRWDDLYESRRELGRIGAEKGQWQEFVESHQAAIEEIAAIVTPVKALVDALADDNAIEAYASLVASLAIEIDKKEVRYASVEWSQTDRIGGRSRGSVPILDVVQLDKIVRDGIDPLSLAQLRPEAAMDMAESR